MAFEASLMKDKCDALPLSPALPNYNSALLPLQPILKPLYHPINRNLSSGPFAFLPLLFEERKTMMKSPSSSRKKVLPGGSKGPQNGQLPLPPNHFLPLYHQWDVKYEDGNMVKEFSLLKKEEGQFVRLCFFG